jgi:hypothetical protein
MTKRWQELLTPEFSDEASFLQDLTTAWLAKQIPSEILYRFALMHIEAMFERYAQAGIPLPQASLDAAILRRRLLHAHAEEAERPPFLLAARQALQEASIQRIAFEAACAAADLIDDPAYLPRALAWTQAALAKLATENDDARKKENALQYQSFCQLLRNP